MRNHFTPDVAEEITDCRLKYDSNGNFRGFAFIGFKGNDTATRTINKYNNSYITTSKIIIEKYQENSTSIKNKLNKKHGEEEYNHEFKFKREKVNPFKEFESDPKFQEFLKVQRNIDEKTNHSKGNYVWSDDVRNDGEMDPINDINQSNDISIDRPVSEMKESVSKKKRHKKKKEERPPKEPIEEKPKYQVKLMKLPCKIKKNQIKEFFLPIIPSKIVSLGAVKGIAYVNFDSESNLNKALLKHKSFLGGKQIDVKNVTEKISEAGNTPRKNDTKSGDSTKKTEYKELTESIADTSRLYIRNLSYAVQSEDIENLFKTFGELSEVYVPIDPTTKKPKGFAFVSFLFPEHAIKALESLDKTVFQGRLIHIIPGASKPDTLKQFNQLSSFKQQKQAEVAKSIEKPNNWNALFLGVNATAGVMAKKYDVSKSQLLADTNARDSIAVRMALGETQIVNETKSFLLENGIDLDSFNDTEGGDETNDLEKRKKRKRSKTTILVKNLPPETKPEEVESLFSKYGSLNRVLLPPHGVTAIVEMQNVSEAKKAFEKMSVFKFKHVPLYLEWAPVNIFKSDAVISTAYPVQVHGVDVETNETEKSSQNVSDDQEETTLFVKNINFDTTDDSFKSHFSKCGPIQSAKVSRRKGTGKSGEPILLSMGFGFVVYHGKKDSEKALRDLQNSLLDGHRLHVARSRSAGSTCPIVARLVVFLMPFYFNFFPRSP